MVSHNSVCMALGLALTVCMISYTQSSDLSSLESLENNDVKTEGFTAAKRPSFYVGSRYGRSSSAYTDSKTRRFSIAPRSDRFFLGSRYGKRSDELAEPAYEQTSLNQSKSPFLLSCIYTGIKNFYRCSNAAEINEVINQLTAGAIQNESSN